MEQNLKSKLSSRFFIVSSMVFVAALSRLIPHPPNFTPLVALSLFGVSQFKKSWQGFLVPLLALFISDLFIGFHSLMWAVYLAFILIGVLGLSLKNKGGATRTATVVLTSSLLFFFFTNAAVWLQSSAYTKDSAGLLLCLTAGLPFLRNEVLGDLFYSTLLFGAFKRIEFALPPLEISSSSPTQKS